jgi:hypothetical protein
MGRAEDDNQKDLDSSHEEVSLYLEPPCPDGDGTDHINVDSSGRTSLGRWLALDRKSPIKTEDGLFSSVSGYWYWLETGDDRLRDLHGEEALSLGLARTRRLPEDLFFREKVKKALSAKLLTSVGMSERFALSSLPLDFYSVRGERPTRPEDGPWILEHLEAERRRLHGELSAEDREI